MTVWIVNPFDNLPSEGCRPQRYWLMADAFARAGHAVVYWTSDFSHARKAKREKVGGEKRWTADGLSLVAGRENAFDVIEIPTLAYPKNVCWTRVRSHRRLARDFERMAMGRIAESSRRKGSQRPLSTSNSHLDLLIASTPPLGLCDAARRVAKRCGAKFVCDIQDAWPETFERLLPRGFKWLGALLFAPLRRTARRLYREADLVTGVSARYRALAARDDFYLAYHGIVVDAASSPRQSKESGFSDGRGEDAASTGTILHLAYIGNLGAGYDLETVIEAVARRAELTLDIAGLGPKEPLLRARVASLGLSSRVRFHGYLGEPSLRTLLAQCDVGVIPMRDDSWVGLPYKLCDYLKAGLSVVSSLHGECGDLLARTDYGRAYAFGDADSLLHALDDLPHVAVSLPPELDADEIYSRFASHVSACLSRVPTKIKLSVIVPSLSGQVPQSLRDQIAGRDDIELVVVTGVSPVGKARNAGLARATGEWIAWVDADDEVTPDWLTKIEEALTDDPDVVTLDACQVGWKGRDDFTWGVDARDATIERLCEDVYRDIRRPSSLWLYVTRRTLWKDLSFDETIRVAEDYLLLPHVLLRARSCRYLPHRLYRYIRTETSLINTQTAALDAAVIDLWERRLAECPPASRGPCRWGLAVSAYWTCCCQIQSATSAEPAARENARRCRALIRRLLPALYFEALVSSTLSLADRISWTLRFVTAAADVWVLQRLHHRRCRT